MSLLSVPTPFGVELALIGLLLALMIVHRRFAMAIKWAVGYCALVVFQQFILPVSPMIIATSFTIFATYTRRMFPCLMTGALMLTCTPLRYLIVALRQLHIPQKLIVAISVTLRYFPAIREEVGYIRDAMKLRDIRGLARLECTVMPLMVSATETAEELSAAAVTRVSKTQPAKPAPYPCGFPLWTYWGCWQAWPCWCSHLWYNRG